MLSAKVMIVLYLTYSVRSQRPFFAGSRPIGYPEVTTTTTASNLADRFGEDNSTTTQRLPIEALGDKDLVDRLSKLPLDKQPFWLINWQALEANRQKPQTYPQRPNSFAQPIVPVQNSRIANGNSTSNATKNSTLETDPILGNRLADSNSFSSEQPNVNKFGSTNLTVQNQNEQNFALPETVNNDQIYNFTNLNSNSSKIIFNQHGLNSKPQKPDSNPHIRKGVVNVNNDADKMYLNTFAHETNETDIKPSDIFNENQGKPYVHHTVNVKDSHKKDVKPVMHPLTFESSDLFNLYRDESDFEGDFFDYLHAPLSHQQVPLHYSDSFPRSNKVRH